MEKVKFPKRLYTMGDEPQPEKNIGYYSNDSKLFPALETVLREDEWEELLDSKLGVFLKFYKLNFGWASRVVQYLLGFQLFCESKYEIWSLIGVNPLRFSLNEFEQLTGLNCDYVKDLVDPDVEVPPETAEFWEKLGVNAELGPSVEQLTEACNYAGEWTREDRIRLGFLSIYVGFTEARRRDTPTPVNMARLVMDLEAFENYPWGRVAFKNLIESVRKANLTKTYTLTGFAEVLQVWAYFAMPEFGGLYGNPFPNKPTLPVLAYSGCRGQKYIKEAMLKQISFNHFNFLEMEAMFPTWDDDVEDPLIQNIVKAMFGEFGGVAWKWKSSHWRVKGVLVSPIVKSKATSGKKRSVASDDEIRKRSCSESPSVDESVDGEAPAYCKTNKTWVLEIDDLYMPLNVKGDHWVALWISLPKRHFVIWDSLRSHSSEEEITKAMEPIAAMVPYLLREVASRDDKEKFSFDTFTHTRVEGVRQQGPGGDCGVYCLKFIEFHALGLPFSLTLCDDKMKVIRENLACDIFHKIECRGPTNRDWADLDIYEGS